MIYRMEISGRGSEYKIFELNSEQKSKIFRLDSCSYDEVESIIDISSFFDGDTDFGVNEDDYYISVYDDNDNLIWESDSGPLFQETEYIDSHNDGNYLFVGDYQKGHFKNYYIDTIGPFNPELIIPIKTEFFGKFELVTDFKYNGKIIDSELIIETESKGWNFIYS